MTVRKYVTEIALTLPSQGTLLIHPKDISKLDKERDEIRELAEDCHIYIIAKRPRLRFFPNSITWANGITSGKLACIDGGVLTEINFTMQGEPALNIVYAPYPHRTIDLTKDGEVIYTLPAHLMPNMFMNTDMPAVHDLEVVYIGMAYGDGNRSAKDRLKSHSTLQQVLADMSADEPDSEALIIMVQYAPPLAVISFDGRDKSVDPNADRDPVRDIRTAEKIINRKVETSLAEAGLIRYFQPRYNDKYKNNFPSAAHVIKEELYTIDFLAFVVELDTEDIHIRLFSPTRLPGYHHIASFDLHDAEERKSFFSLLESSSSYRAENFSGPIF
jgi:hypothetical protein